MRKEILKRFAAGTCSVCMLYAFSYSAVEALTSEAAGSAPAVVASATPSATATPAPTQDSASASSDNYPTCDQTYSGKHGRGYSWSGEAIAPSDSTSGQQISAADSASSQTDSSQTITSGSDATGSSPPTLNQYLSALRCGGCRRNCLLINPRCMNGRSKAETATTEYYDLYGDQ